MLRKLVSLATAGLLAVGSQVGLMAQEEEVDLGGDASAQIDEVGELFEAEPVVYQITFPRVQAIVTPVFMLDAFFDVHPNHWSKGQTNWAFGGEFIIRRLEEFDLVFGLDWADIRTTDDWWRESDKTLVDTDWGQNGLSLLTLDVAINWFTSVKPWWDIYYGVGLGVAIVLGEFYKTDVDPQCIIDAGVDPFESTDHQVIVANCQDANGNPRLEPNATPEKEDSIPPLIPALTLTLGSRFIIDGQWAIQLEAGFKNIYFYGALELGFIFE